MQKIVRSYFTTFVVFILAVQCFTRLSADNAVKVSSREEGLSGDSMENTKSTEIRFPPMFVMNLERSTDRWAYAKRQMENAGLDVERFDAIDGRVLSNEQLKEVSTNMAMYLQPRGVLGCYLSHRRFWQMVVDMNYESAIIFEDDVRLVPDFKDKLYQNLQSMGDDKYDVVLLGAIGRVHPDGRDHIGAVVFSSYIGGTRPLKRFSENYYQPRRPAVSVHSCTNTVDRDRGAH
jgi:Glycosyltransferase family 25 (LPS biosynthesis protein)